MPSSGRRGQKKVTRDADGCDIREACFARNYVRLKGDAEKAASEAGYSGDLGHRACNLLKRPHVAGVIQRETARVLAALDMEVADVIRELVRIASFDVRRLFDEDGRMLKISELDEDTSHAIASVSEGEGYIRIVACNKLGALQLLYSWLHKTSIVDDPYPQLRIHFHERTSNEQIQ